MYILEISPFTKRLGKSLTYFSNKKVSPGQIVEISLRKKISKGLVLNCKEGQDLKQEIKDSDYRIKKIHKILGKQLFSEEFMKGCEQLSERYLIPITKVLSILTPASVLQNSKNLEADDSCGKKLNKKKSDTKKENNESVARATQIAKYIIQTSDSERYSEYRSLIRTQFAKKKSVLFCVPTIEDTANSEKMLSKGIEKNTFVFHGKLSSKKIFESWKKAVAENRPSLIICTPQFLGIPRKDIDYIIVERENSKAYKSFASAFFDYRFLAEKLAENLSAVLLFGDLLLRAETLLRYDNGEFIEHAQIKFRFLNSANSSLVKMKKENGEIMEKESGFKIISIELENLLKKAHNENERCFLLVARKGLSPSVICGDCSKPVLCEICSSPMVLYSKNKKIFSGEINHEENFLKCNYCANEKNVDILCQNCGSWKLTGLGIGIDQVYKKIKEIIPNENIFLIDKEKCKTIKQSRDVVENFLNNPAGVLIGTELSLLYLNEEIENAAVVSVDSMLSIPDFQIKERMVNILLRTKSKARNNFLIQTRHADNHIFKAVLSGNLADFYRHEFVERKQFNYPPFKTLIKIKGVSKEEKKLHEDFEKIKKILEPEELKIYSPKVEKIKTTYFLNGLIKARNNWFEDYSLKQKLLSLPPNFKVEIEADNLF